jgi:DNA polymerase-3 subunit delta'
MKAEELWATVVGQAEAVRVLQAAAQAPVHAYLLVGPEGAGRLAAARAFAGSLLAGQDEGPEGLRHRRLAAAGKHADLVEISPQGRALLVAEAESIIVEGSRSPVEAQRKIVMVDRFHTAEPEAAASLLKTIEEPPPTVVFVLLADEVPDHQITISSRCVRVDLPALDAEVIAETLVAEGVDGERALLVGEASAGSLTRARMLVSDPAISNRQEAWRSVPRRLDGTGAAVAVLVAEVRDLISDAEGPLAVQHKQELDDLVEREESLGLRGAGRRDLVGRQKRELRRLRDDELRFGLATLARGYLAHAQEDDALAEGALAATALITEATGELVRNPNEALMLQALFLDLPSLP